MIKRNDQQDQGQDRHDLTALQKTILDSIKNLTGDKTFKSYLNGFVNDFGNKNNDKYSKWEVFKIVIRNTIFNHSFWQILFNHFADIINLMKSTYDQDYINALDDNNFSDVIAGSTEVQLFIKSLGENKDKISAAISYMMNLPDHNEDQILDKVFMLEIVNWFTKNQGIIGQQDIKAFITLASQRMAIELKSRIPGQEKVKIDNELLDNNLKFTAKCLEICSKIQDFNKLFASKYSIITEFLAKNMPLNGVTKVMKKESFAHIIQEMLDPGNIERNSTALKKIVDILIEKNQVYNKFGNFRSKDTSIAMQKTSLQVFINKQCNSIKKISISDTDKKFFNEEINSANTTDALQKVQEQIAAVISQKYIMTMGKFGMELMHKLPNTLKVISSSDNHSFFFSQCFYVKSKEGKITYTLSPMGKSLLSFGFMKFNEPHSNFANLQTDETLLNTWEIAIDGKDSLTKDDFEREVLAKFDTQLLRDALPTMTTDTANDFANFLQSFNSGQDMFTWFPMLFKTMAANHAFQDFLVQHKDVVTYFAKQMTPAESMAQFGLDKDQLFKPEFIGDLMGAMTPNAANQFGAFMDDLRNGMPVFTWMPKMLQAAADNKDLAQVLIKHKDTISYLAGQMSEKAIKDFGLSKEFMKEIVTCALKDEKSIEAGYNLFCALASENYSQMAAYTFELLKHNEELRELLQDTESHKEIGSLMEALGFQNDTIKEYFNRSEFNGLKTGINPLMVGVLPKLMNLLNQEGKLSLLETLNKLMANNGIPNGIGLSKEANAISNIKLRDNALEAIYLYSIGVKTFDNVKESIFVLGIETENELKTKIEEAKVNDAAVKLCNEILATFKADLPENKADLTQEEQYKVADIKTRQAAELQVMTEIINGNGNIYDDIKSAVEEGKLSQKNAGFLKIRFDQYFHQLTPARRTLLLKRTSHELRVKSFEKFGLTKENGVVVDSIHSGVFSELTRRLEKQLENESINQDKLKELIRNNTAILFSADQIEELSGLIMNSKDEITKTNVVDMLNDLNYRRKGSEGVSNIQDLLNAVFAPIAALTKLPYGISLSELNSTLGKIEDKQYSNDDIKTFLTANLISCRNIDALMKEFIAKDDVVVLGENEKIDSKSKAELIAALSLVKSEYDQTMKILNKLLEYMTQSDQMMETLNKIVLGKGVNGIDKVALVRDLQGLLLSLNTSEERKTLNKLITSIAYSILQNPYYVKTLSNKLKRLEDPANDQAIRDFLNNAIEIYNDPLNNKIKTIKEIPAVGIEAVESVIEYLTIALVPSNADVKKFQEIVQALQLSSSEIDIRGILRGEFPMSVHALSGQDLGNIDLSNAKFNGIILFNTNLSMANFLGAKFTGCTFNNCELPSPNQLKKATFDIDSFTTFIANAEAKKVDIMAYLKPDLSIKIQTDVANLSPFEAYKLIKAAQAKKIKLSDQHVLDTAKPLAKHSLFDQHYNDLSYMKILDINMILEEFYNQRVIGNFKPSKEARDSNMTAAECAAKAQLYKGKTDELASDLTKAIAYKLSYERYLNALNSNLLYNVEHIYNAVYDKVHKLSYEDRQEIKENLDDITTKIYDPLYKITQYSDFVGSLYVKSDKINNIENIIDIELSIRLGQSPEIWRQASHAVDIKTLKNLGIQDATLKLIIDYCSRTKEDISNFIKKSIEFELVNKILKSNPELEKNRDELYRLDEDVLDVINKHPTMFVQRSAIDIQKGYMWNSNDNSFHNQVYGLDAENLKNILSIGSNLFNYIKEESRKQPLNKILENKEKIRSVGSIVTDTNFNLMKPYINTLFTTNQEVLEVINGNQKTFCNVLQVAEKHGLDSQIFTMSKTNLEALLLIKPDDILEKMSSYCKRSGKKLSDMLKHKDILDNLEKFSKELEDRYKRFGEKDPQKFCLNLVVKIYNDMKDDQQQDLVKFPEYHAILADLAFSAINNNNTKLNLDEVSEFSKTIVSKIKQDACTTALAKEAKTQGEKIACDVFKSLGVSGYLKGATKESQQNFANIIASRIFLSGKVINKENLPQFIGEAKPITGYFSSRYARSTGLVKAFLDIYGTSLSYNEVKKFDKDLTPRMIDSVDTLISGKSVAKSVVQNI